MIKVSDYIAKFISNMNITKVFCIQGGASAHMIDSIARCSGIEYICNQHEQASAMSADGYARVGKKIGVAIATSGPGATNLLTGCCSAYYDSVPVLFLTGQVASFRLKGDLGIRQLGFQETDTISIFKSVVKYCVQLKKPEDIGYELEKAVYIATHGRKGPVLIDIPDDYQRCIIDETQLRKYIYDDEKNEQKKNNDIQVKDILKDIQMHKRPLIIAGRGIHIAGAEKIFEEVISKLKIPVVSTWGANDLLEEKNPLKVGTFGINGTRYGNFAVQKADYILVIGSRLDTHVAGSPLKNFSPNSKRVVVDIDEFELKKYQKLDFCVSKEILLDANDFLSILLEELSKAKCDDVKSEWLSEIRVWKEKYPICKQEYYLQNTINPYCFVKELSEQLIDGEMIFCDTGCSLVWMNQAFDFKRGQRIFSSYNNTPMGYSLPASIGAAIENNERIICISGDGGLQMNIQELATVMRHKLNIKLFLFENKGYGMIQRTQDMWFESNYEASDIEHGLAFPEFSKILMDYGFQTVILDQTKDLKEKISEVLNCVGPTCAIIKIDKTEPIIPQLKAGHSLEDMEPYLSDQVLQEEMAI